MKSFKLDRLQKELKKLVNAIFHGDIDDQRISGIEITDIKVSKDQSQMKIYFTGQKTDIPLEKTIELLTKTSGFIKKQIAGANIMRTIPNISFHHDNTPQRVEKIDELLKVIAAQKKNHNYYDNDNDNEYYDDDDDDYEEDDLDEYDDYNDDLADELDDYDDIDEEDED